MFMIDFLKPYNVLFNFRVRSEGV